VEAAPLEPGVYGLWNGEELIYIGSSDAAGSSIRSCLMQHLSGGAGPRPDHYSWEVAADPKRRKAESLEQFRTVHRRLPKLNRERAS
jgi:5S rRNA maturation endonuclease (ribonuclease M5)